METVIRTKLRRRYQNRDKLQKQKYDNHSKGKLFKQGTKTTPETNYRSLTTGTIAENRFKTKLRERTTELITLIITLEAIRTRKPKRKQITQPRFCCGKGDTCADWRKLSRRLPQRDLERVGFLGGQVA